MPASELKISLLMINPNNQNRQKKKWVCEYVCPQTPKNQTYFIHKNNSVPP